MQGSSKEPLFQFAVARGTDGSYTWFYEGDGESIEEMKERIGKLPARITDLSPVLKVKIDAVENISDADTNHPLRIAYSLDNLGGTPAAGIFVDWAVLNPQTSMMSVWSNKWDTNFVRNVVLPDHGVSTSVRNADPHSPITFNGLMSGNLRLLGLISFKDLENHDGDPNKQSVRNTLSRFFGSLPGSWVSFVK